MNKKKLTIIVTIGLIICPLSYYFVIGVIIVPKNSLPEIDDFEVGNALTVFEMIGEEKMRKETKLRDLLGRAGNGEKFWNGKNIWNEIEKLRKETDRLDEELWYRKEMHLQLYIIYNLSKSKITPFGYVFSFVCTPYGVPRGISVDYESEITKQKNEVELLRVKLVKKELELKELYKKRDNSLVGEINKLRDELERSDIARDYASKREVLLYTVLLYKLKKSESLEITASWEEGEHYLSPERDHVWVGLYNTSIPDISNSVGEYTTDVFTSNMNYYWEEALKKKPETKLIRIKWIHLSQGHRIIWEGNKNEKEEWYTFSKYNGDPEEGNYNIVNMNLLNYPEYQQYYVVEWKFF